MGAASIAFLSLRQQLDLELLHDRLRDLVLDGEDVGQIAVVAIGPEMRPVLRIDQLRVDADALARLSDAAFENVGDVEAPAHLLHVGVLALVGEGRIPRDDRQRRDLRQIGDDVLGDAVGEVFLLGIAAHVGERKHRDRRLRLC